MQGIESYKQLYDQYKIVQVKMMFYPDDNDEVVKANYVPIVFKSAYDFDAHGRVSDPTNLLLMPNCRRRIVKPFDQFYLKMWPIYQFTLDQGAGGIQIGAPCNNPWNDAAFLSPTDMPSDYEDLEPE
jgi:hypothetical protein